MADYLVRPGDTLKSIARVFDIPLTLLISANPRIMNPDKIDVGQTIRFPPGYPIKREINTNGFAFPEIDRQVLQDTFQYLTFLSIYSYHIRSDGSLEKIDDFDMVQLARQARVAPLMVIANIDESGFSGNLAHTILADESLQRTLINNVIGILKAKNYYGLNVNFQDVFPSDVELFSRFFQLVTTRLYPLGYMVTATRMFGPDYNRILNHIPEFAAYGRLVNQVFIIVGYAVIDHGPPLAIVPIGQVRLVLDHAVAEVPSQSILLGMTNYGLDWILPYKADTSAQMVTFSQAEYLAARMGAAIQFDETTQSPYFYYEDDMGARHIVWFDDERSIRIRLELIRIYNLGGVSFWTINVFSPESYQTLISMYDIRKVL